jgi:pectate lyase
LGNSLKSDVDMKHIKRIALFLLAAHASIAQGQCTVVGWASQNGGVTGGGTATPTVVDTYEAFKTAVTSATVKVVHVSGTITIPSGGRISFQDQTDKTIFGLPGSRLVSKDLTKDNSGIMYMKRCSNIILQNMIFEGPGAYDTDGSDNFTIDNSTNIWVDHCEFQDGMDGNLDVKNMADYISITWTKFMYNKAPIAGGPGGSDDHRFTNLFGSGDDVLTDRGKLRVTLYNCWWAPGCKARMPRVRFGKVHIANSYYNSTASTYCVQAGFESDLLIEGNVFENVKYPIDQMDGKFTAITEKNNIYTNVTGTTAGKGTAFTPPYTLPIIAASQVKATVTAGAGATLTSANCNNTNKNPIVSITAPTNNATFTAPASITLSATASDPDGTISKVEFYNGSTLLGSDNSSAYSYTWTNVAAGSYTITAKAYDNSTGTATSTAVSITVNGTGQNPTVSITAPANNATFTAPASITIDATAADADGSISNVEFYNGSTLLGSDNSSPYSYTWSNVAEGTYSLTAKAYDNSASTAISTAVSVVVNGPISTAATLTKRGAGSSSQTVEIGTAIAAFSYDWTNASTVTVTGLPTGIQASIDNTAKNVAFSGAPSQSGTFKFTLSTVGGSPNATKTGTFTVTDLTTGLQSALLGSDWAMFPNPTTHSVTLEKTEGQASVRLYDAMGMMLSETKANGKLVLGEELPTGLYILTIVEADKTKTLRFVKE